MAFSEEVQRIINLKVDRLETIPDAFSDRMVRIQRAKFNDITRLLDELDYKNGFVVVNDANILRIEVIVEQIKDVLTGAEYETAVGELMQEFDNQAAINYKYFEAIDPRFQVPAISNNILRAKKNEAILSLLNSTDQYLTNPMRQSLSNTVLAGGSRADLLDTFRDLIQGDPEKVGRLERATRQIVSDTFATSDRAITNEVAEQLGLKFYLYTGGLLKTTRPFCKERNGKFFKKSDVESWGELGDWAGKMEGTNSKTIFQTAGGYNCQHSILPVSEAVVPDEAKNRGASAVNINISNKSGYDIDINDLNAHAKNKAKEYGLTGNVGINIKKSKNTGGGVGWGDANAKGQIKLKNDINITTDGSLSKRQYEQIINHEMTHLKQGQSDSFFLKKEGRDWTIFWEGKEYMKMSEYNKLTTRFQNPRLKASTRLKALKDYVNLPWELEAHLNDGDAFGSLLK
jgi:hypothetical protein